jgi:hypothetical protein
MGSRQFEVKTVLANHRGLPETISYVRKKVNVSVQIGLTVPLQMVPTADFTEMRAHTYRNLVVTVEQCGCHVANDPTWDVVEVHNR